MIGITMGDVCGCGPEILIKSYFEKKLPENYLVIGETAAVKLAEKIFGFDVKINHVKSPAECTGGSFNLLDTGLLTEADITIGKISKKCGFSSWQTALHAAELAVNNRISAIVTLPVCKEAIRLSVPGFTGHTELFAGKCGVGNYAMMLAAPDLIAVHVSTHVSLKQAAESLCTERVLEVIRHTCSALKKLKRSGCIAVCGLNPHAGENGAFGDEEKNIFYRL